MSTRGSSPRPRTSNSVSGAWRLAGRRPAAVDDRILTLVASEPLRRAELRARHRPERYRHDLYVTRDLGKLLEQLLGLLPQPLIHVLPVQLVPPETADGPPSADQHHAG